MMLREEKVKIDVNHLLLGLSHADNLPSKFARVNVNLQGASMKELLLIVGIISIIACVLSLLYAALNRHGYYHLLDGEGDMYTRLHRRMIVFFVVGIVLAVIGVVCIIIWTKI